MPATRGFAGNVAAALWSRFPAMGMAVVAGLLIGLDEKLFSQRKKRSMSPERKRVTPK
jgi:hypothetical protein